MSPEGQQDREAVQAVACTMTEYITKILKDSYLYRKVQYFLKMWTGQATNQRA